MPACLHHFKSYNPLFYHHRCQPFPSLVSASFRPLSAESPCRTDRIRSVILISVFPFPVALYPQKDSSPSSAYHAAAVVECAFFRLISGRNIPWIHSLNDAAQSNRANKNQTNAHNKNKDRTQWYFSSDSFNFSRAFCGIVWYLAPSATPYAARGRSWYHIQCIRVYSMNRESCVRRHSTRQRGITREKREFFKKRKSIKAVKPKNMRG